MCWSDSTLAKAGMPLESDPILDDQEPFPVWTAVRNRRRGAPFAARRFTCTDGQRDRFAQYSQAKPRRPRVLRSEERRVGKECRCRGAQGAVHETDGDWGNDSER